MPLDFPSLRVNERYRRLLVGGAQSEIPEGATVELLMNFNGADESTTFEDLSANNHTITVTGNAKNDDVQFKFGTTSLNCAANGDFLTLPDALGVDMGFFNVDNQATCEAWIYPTDTAGTTCPFGFRGDTGGGWSLYYFSGELQLQIYNLTTLVGHFVGTTTIALNTWHHVAVTQDGLDWVLWLNGVSEVTGTTSDLPTVGNPDDPTVGNDRDTIDRTFKGWMDGVRFTQGPLIYTEAFDVPTEAPGL